jgi:hypothetical protein
MAGPPAHTDELFWPIAWRLRPEFEPRNLRDYVPSQWKCRAHWHAARARYIQAQLFQGKGNRGPMPNFASLSEIQPMTSKAFIPTPANNPAARPDLKDINAASQEQVIEEWKLRPII